MGPKTLQEYNLFLGIYLIKYKNLMWITLLHRAMLDLPEIQAVVQMDVHDGCTVG